MYPYLPSTRRREHGPTCGQHRLIRGYLIIGSFRFLSSSFSFTSDYSKQLNASRLRVLQAQDAIVKEMKANAEKELLKVSSDTAKYSKLLEGLILQVEFCLRYCRTRDSNGGKRVTVCSKSFVTSL